MNSFLDTEVDWNIRFLEYDQHIFWASSVCFIYVGCSLGTIFWKENNCSNTFIVDFKFIDGCCSVIFLLFVYDLM